ncbi:MAG: aminotransferase class V-fold PLP-dependent enzyme [Alicyclobacillus sp.]|nr:aminotransferase class V-fold PLP-dependent enzyme [Alicyclobacillus sp.]
MRLTPLVEKSAFIGLDRCTWLYTGAESPAHHGVADAMMEYLHRRGEGPGGREFNAQVEEACKANIARLVGGDASQVAFLANASEAISMVAQSLGLRAGDNVVIHELEFPSGVLPWLRMRERGLEVRVVPHRNWRISVEDILAKVDERTRLLMTSHVSYLSGHRLDYQRLHLALENTPALLLLDVTQSLGAVPVDIRHADILVCSSYKWLLATHGAGILALNPVRVRDLCPPCVGWRSVQDMFGPERFERFTFHADARRFDLGYPSYPTLSALRFSSALLLNVGVERIERHILELGTRLVEGLKRLGLNVMTPADPSERAGNISFTHEDGEGLAGRLRQEGVLVWGGDGRVRASVHLFNDDGDVEHFLSVLERVLQT